MAKILAALGWIIFTMIIVYIEPENADTKYYIGLAASIIIANSWVIAALSGDNK